MATWGMYLFAAGRFTSLAIELILENRFLQSLHVTILLVLVVMLWDAGGISTKAFVSGVQLSIPLRM